MGLVKLPSCCAPNKEITCDGISRQGDVYYVTTVAPSSKGSKDRVGNSL